MLLLNFLYSETLPTTAVAPLRWGSGTVQQELSEVCVTNLLPKSVDQ